MEMGRDITTSLAFVRSSRSAQGNSGLGLLSHLEEDCSNSTKISHYGASADIICSAGLIVENLEIKAFDREV